MEKTFAKSWAIHVQKVPVLRKLGNNWKTKHKLPSCDFDVSVKSFNGSLLCDSATAEDSRAIVLYAYVTRFSSVDKNKMCPILKYKK